MKYIWPNTKNIVDFFLRENLSFSRKNYSEKNESKENLFSDNSLIQKEQELFNKYDLAELKNNSTRLNYLENLHLLDLLDKHFPITPQENLKILDIGCKNWFYAKGEYFFFKKYCENLNMDGVEIDTKRLYSNFYTRGEVAKFYIKGLDNVNYISGDFLNLKTKYNYIVWILPFIIKEPLLKWGLPLNYFKPEEMLLHAVNSLEQNGKLLIINQGEEEYSEQKRFCKKLNIRYKEIGEIKSDFIEYKKRYAILIDKTI